MVDLSEMIPVASQGIANIVVAAVIGVIGAYGYYRKYREGDVAKIVDTSLEALRQIAGSNEKTVVLLEKIVFLIEDQIHREELDREYQRGRDAILAEATSKVAANLKRNPSSAL